MKSLKTLALASIVAISACSTPSKTLDTPQVTAQDTLYQLQAGTDRMYEDMTSKPLRRTLTDKTDIRYRVDQDVVDAFATRYYGLDALSRSKYFTQDLLQANQTIKDLRTRAHATAAQDRREDRNYQARIDDLEGELRRLRTQLRDKPRVVYQDRIIERHDAVMKYKGIDHPVEVNTLFIRLGETYFQFPHAQIVCPGRDSARRACIDVNDVRNDYREHEQLGREEWRRDEQ